MTTLLILVIVFALAFDYINGFHDTANAIATVVSTRVLTPLAAVLMAGALNFLGAVVAKNVAEFMAKGIVSPAFAPESVVLGAVLGAIVWNLITWRFGIPSSSSHALIGGLIGSAVTHGFTLRTSLPNGPFGVVDWLGVSIKVLIPLIASPLLGLVIGFFLMKLIALLFSHWHPRGVGAAFKRLQLLSSALMAFSHGQNDAQKSMGIITLALIGAGILPHSSMTEIPMWVVLSCAGAMGLGTAAGGWRIIRTMGHKIIRLEPVNGFAAETAGAAVILTASKFGIPVSTTHCIAGSIFGVGAAKRVSAVRWQVAINMVIAWVVTIPAAAAFGAIGYGFASLFGS